MAYRQNPTIAAFQREDRCRQDVDAASYRCACATDADSLIQLEIDHSASIRRWLDAVQATRNAHAEADTGSHPTRLLI